MFDNNTMRRIYFYKCSIRYNYFIILKSYLCMFYPVVVLQDDNIFSDRNYHSNSEIIIKVCLLVVEMAHEHTKTP